MITVGIKLVRPSSRRPSRATYGSAGWDVFADIHRKVEILPFHRELIPTGLIFDIPPGFEIQVRPRSGLALKNGLTVLNSPGTIDSDYRLEVGVILINHGDNNFVVNPGDRIAQLVVAPVIQVEMVEMDSVTEVSDRKGGFGSTGMK